MTTFAAYIALKFLIETVFMILWSAAVLTIWNSPNLRKSPIFCCVGFALSTDIIKTLIVFYFHDLPSAVLRDDMFDSVHGLISFVAMTQWFSHLFNLFLMTGYYCILLYNSQLYARLARYRFRALAIILLAGAVFASPYLNSDYYGFDFTLESLSWSFNHSKPASLIYTLISWFFLVLLTIVVLTAAIVMMLFIRGARKRNEGDVKDQSRQKAIERVQGSKLVLIALFFGITIAYYVPVLSFVLTPVWYTENLHILYEVLDLLEDVVDGSKWLIYAMSSVEFRRALIHLPCFTCNRVQNVHII